MRYRDYLKETLSANLPKDVELPRKFHLVGHVVLLYLNSEMLRYAAEIGNATLRFDKRIKSVAVKIGPTSGTTRQPSYVVVAGERNTITTHIENQIRFRLDPLRVTFSGGNRRERMRVANLVKDDENVVDMFSCVGQFALHIAKSAEVKVTAIEINPEAFEFLVENIELNELENKVTALLGDCRKVNPKKVANRVVMGYLHDTIEYLPYALETLVEDGGVVHMHMNIPEARSKDIAVDIEQVCSEYGYSSNTMMQHVKNYSPRVSHFVFDIAVTPEA